MRSQPGLGRDSPQNRSRLPANMIYSAPQHQAIASAIVAGTRTPARQHPRALLLLTSLAIAGLAACAQQQAPPQAVAVETPEAPPPPAVRPRHAVPRPTRKPAPPEEETAPGEGAALEAPTTEPHLTAPPQVGELIGLDQQGAARLFGDAAEHSERPPATVWRYRTASCELDLFFYLDLRSGQMRTLHYAFKGDTGDAGKRQECLRAIVDQGRHSRKAADAAPARG
jgi:hypothetical protein